MYCIHSVTTDYKFKFQCKLKIFWLMCHQNST